MPAAPFVVPHVRAWKAQVEKPPLRLGAIPSAHPRPLLPPLPLVHQLAPCKRQWWLVPLVHSLSLLLLHVLLRLQLQPVHSPPLLPLYEQPRQPRLP